MNIKKLILLLVLMAIMLGGLYGLYVFFSREPADIINPPTGTEFPPVATSTNNNPQGDNQTISIRTSKGGSTLVRDFRKDQFVEAIADGDYVIRDTASESTTTFDILYASKDAGFIISLRKEPLRETRIVAETALMQHLGVSQEKLCDLVIFVGVARDINEFYAGQALGVSNCPGSQPL